jgi:ribosome recycling factor
MLDITLTEGASTKQFESSVEKVMDEHLKHFEKELLKIRAGRANTALLDDIRVSCYGSLVSLKEIAAVSAPDSQLLTIQPWDKSIIPDIEKAIAASPAGMTPANDGTIIRIALPKMSSARRDELVKLLHSKIEDCKVAFRNGRKDVHILIRDAERAKKLSEDYAKRLNDLLQKILDKYMQQAETLGSKKELEIRAV